MKWLWTHGGKCFGYLDRDNLWTYSGKHVGKLYDNEVYGTDGTYLGEISNGDRLITHRSKTSYHRSPFTPYGNHAGYPKYADDAGYAMCAGYEDFPPPENF